MENVTENYDWNESEILGSHMNSCEGDAQARGMADAVNMHFCYPATPVDRQRCMFRLEALIS
jgi:hypothetical protein